MVYTVRDRGDPRLYKYMNINLSQLNNMKYDMRRRLGQGRKQQLETFVANQQA